MSHMSEDTEIGPLISKRDKAIATGELKEKLKRERDTSEEEAIGVAIHEARHAFKDKKPGAFRVPPKGNAVIAEYRPIGERTREETIEIAQGPGEDMSGIDSLVVEALAEPPAFIKFVFRIFDLFNKKSS